MFFSHFLEPLFNDFRAVCGRPRGCGGAGAHLEKPGFRMEGVSNFGLRCFSRAARKDRKRNEKQHRKQHQQASISDSKSNRKKPSKMIIFGAKMAPKVTPRSLSEAAGAPRKHTKARNRKRIHPKNAPRAAGSEKKEPRGG